MNNEEFADLKMRYVCRVKVFTAIDLSRQHGQRRRIGERGCVVSQALSILGTPTRPRSQPRFVPFDGSYPNKLSLLLVAWLCLRKIPNVLSVPRL